jgi:hypothetical protein
VGAFEGRGDGVAGFLGGRAAGFRLGAGAEAGLAELDLGRARQRDSAWASVLAVMKSTPCTPSRIMWSTALPPAPPTPITLMLVPPDAFSTISNI